MWLKVPEINKTCTHTHTHKRRKGVGTEKRRMCAEGAQQGQIPQIEVKIRTQKDQAPLMGTVMN